MRGGIAQHTYLLTDLLRIRGNEVDVISYRRIYPSFLFPGRTVYDPSSLKLDPGAHSLMDTLNPVTWTRTIGRVRRFVPDVVLLEWWNPVLGPALGFIARRLRAAGFKTVYECHNVLPHESHVIDLPLTSWAFSPANHFIVHSESDKSILLKTFPDKHVGVAPLPSPDFFEGNTSDRRGHNILFFGLIRAYKGLEILLRAMPAVLKRVPDCRLVIAGEFYEDKAKYLRIIDELGIIEAVRVDDRYLPNEEIPALFEQADVLAMPYLSATQSVVAEMGIRAGLPIIASRTGGLAETVVEMKNGLLVPPGNADSLAKAIIRYFTEGLGPILSSSNSKSESNRDSGLVDLVEQLAQAKKN